MLQLRVPKSLVYPLFLLLGLLGSSLAYPSFAQKVLSDRLQSAASCEPFVPTPKHPVPGKLPLSINTTVNYFEYHANGGDYRRSSCPAVNVLANRGFINRSGRNITADELTKAFRDIYNFGIDVIVTVLWPAFAVHGRPNTLDLDQFNDEKVQHVVNAPGAPTRNDFDMGDNIDINMTLWDSLVSFSKDGTTLTLEDLAEHHHLRHNQSKLENPKFRFSNRDAIVTLAQYSNLVGTLGRNGPNGPSTLYIDDLRTFYVDEDLPANYERRELALYSPESNMNMDRMSTHIGFKIERPFPPDDNDGRDVEPWVAKYEM